MNLGQLIGELIYGEATGAPHAPVAHGLPNLSRTPRQVHPDRQGQVLDLVRERKVVVAADLTRYLGITPCNASVVLYTMRNNGKLVRSGTHGSYTYQVA